MLCVEDYLDALQWAEKLGGLNTLMARADANADAIAAWVGATPWVEFLAEVPNTRSNTSVCLKLTDPGVSALDKADQSAFIKSMTGLLADEDVAHDIGSYRDAPPGLRIWGRGDD